MSGGNCLALLHHCMVRQMQCVGFCFPLKHLGHCQGTTMDQLFYLVQEALPLLHQFPGGILAAYMSERSSFINMYNTEILLLLFLIYLKCVQQEWELPTQFSIENFRL